MPDQRFFDIGSKIDLDQAAALSFTRQAVPGEKGSGFIEACSPLSFAGPSGSGVTGRGRAAFFSDRRYLKQLRRTEAEFIFVPEAFVDDVPKTSVALIAAAPQAAWSRIAAHLYRTRMHEGPAAIHPGARLEDGVEIGVGVVIGQGAVIGAGTRIEAYAVIGPGVQIGRGGFVGTHASVHCALIGDRVKLQAGARIGEAGFGVSGDARGLVDVPQLGRVILQDDVSIGSETCVDRGAYDDTVVGEGTKIDNQCQIGHNTHIGRNCILAAQCGLSGSVRIGDGAMFGGGVGVIDHIDIGAGARMAAGCRVYKDVPAGMMVAGDPAKPSRQHLREVVWLEKNAAKDRG
jgi:UDP-3-O-[3-hydroxymyristoyl] glucosamine N-acyltransferase